MIAKYLSQKVWSNLFSYLEGFSGIYVKNRRKTKRFLSGVFWILRTGAQWRELPKFYGKYRSVHKRYDAWQRQGVWKGLFEHFSQDENKKGEWVLIDSTIVRAHPCSVGLKRDTQDQEALGRSKGGFTTKIHALVDALGKPLDFILTPGQRSDVTQAPALISGIENAKILADKGYDADSFRAQIKEQNCKAVIPPRRNRKELLPYDTALYKERNLIERFFRNLKNFRRIFSRFEKTSQNYLAFIHLASTLLRIK